MSGFLTLVPALGAFVFFSWLGLSKFDMIAVLFCYVLLLSLRSLSFFKERQEGSEFSLERRWGGTAVAGGEAVFRFHRRRKESVFDKRG